VGAVVFVGTEGSVAEDLPAHTAVRRLAHCMVGGCGYGVKGVLYTKAASQLVCTMSK
jgi:hypothetical protein